ncbi:MAG: hypothetical protein J7K29_03075 [Candidatus Cloacimonetes bacterium]|nr:hypothetical protein [Candidatus Cloacimonadota bacterium]
MEKEELKIFLKYVFTKPIQDFIAVLRKPSNWYTILLVFAVFTLINAYIRAGYVISKMKIPFHVFLVYLMLFVVVALYKEWIGGKWKHELRKKYLEELEKKRKIFK